jgi:O-antigen/teichoic acid export membrane protein
VLGEQWALAVPILQVLTLLGALNAILYFDRSVLIATGHARSAFYLTLGQTVFGVALVLVGVQWGVMGVAAAVVARQYLYWPVRMLLLKRQIGLKVSRYLGAWAVPFCVTAVGVGAAFGLNALWPALTEFPWLKMAVDLVLVTAIVAGGTLLVSRSTVKDVLSVLKSRAG